MMLYVLVVWLNASAPPAKIAVYEHKDICEMAKGLWAPRGEYARCLPVESRSAVVESQR